MWWTTLAFVGLSVLLVVRHVRRSAPEPARGRPCPRCGVAMPLGAALCPSCGVPVQAFELVQAPMASSAAAEASGPLHALVRTDVCVGCGTCVDACPEPGALRLVQKVATVDLDRCKGHGSCAAACPVGAIVVTSGAAVQRIEVPALNAHFETNVPGLYVVGELGGRGLIKNAVNEGKIAVEHVADATARERGRDVEAGTFDLIIAGSGPAGLSAALEAHRRGLRYVVLEQGTLADSIRKYPRQKLLLAEPVRTPLYGDLWVSDASKETLLEIWQTVIARRGLKIRTGERVEGVEREPVGFRVTTSVAEYRSRRVVLALGRRGTPRRLEVPGEDLDRVFYDIVEMEAFAGQRVLVVGGGDSAVESALGLANQPDTGVTLSYRGQDFARIKERNRSKLERAVAEGRVRAWLGSQVREIRRDAVVLEHEGRLQSLPNDIVIIRIGGEAPFPFLERCGVRIVSKEIALAPAMSAG